MAFDRELNWTFNHVDQGDKLYDVYTSSQIKQMFDSRGIDLKAYVDRFISYLQTDEGLSSVGSINDNLEDKIAGIKEGTINSISVSDNNILTFSMQGGDKITVALPETGMTSEERNEIDTLKSMVNSISNNTGFDEDTGNFIISVADKQGFDGYSPKAVVTQGLGSATITITDKIGTTIATVNDGEDGKPPVIELGAVSTVSNSEQANAILEKTDSGYKLNLAIPRGANGINAGSGTVSIVDNLTTGGSTNVLSAEQGKVLKNKIDSIVSGGPVTTTSYTEEPDYTNLATATYITGGRVTSSTTGNPIITTSSTGYYSIFNLPISETISSTNPIRIKGLKFYSDTSRVYGGDSSNNLVQSGSHVNSNTTSNVDITSLSSSASGYCTLSYDASEELITITAWDSTQSRLNVCGYCDDSSKIVLTIGEEIKTKLVEHTVTVPAAYSLNDNISVSTDTSLTSENKPANAKAVGDKIADLEDSISDIQADTVPSYVVSNVNNCITSLNSYETSETASIAFITDLHCKAFSYTLSDSFLPMKHIVQALNKIEETNYIDFHVLGGDYIDQNNSTTNHAAAVTAYKKIRDIFMPLKNSLFALKGNHDDNSIVLTENTLTVDDVIQTVEEYRYLGKNFEKSGVVGDVGHLGDMYGYYDIPNKKIRCIFLNTIDITYTETSDGKLEHNGQSFYTMRQKQMDFVANALKFDETGWGVVFFSHVALISNTDLVCAAIGSTSNCIWDIIKAYKNKTHLVKSNTDGYEGYDYSIDVDYTNNASNEVIACICGHNHQDKTGVSDGIRLISTGCASSTKNTTAADGSTLTPTPSSATETLFDIFTIDRANKKIYATRYGLGSNRTFDY